MQIFLILLAIAFEAKQQIALIADNLMAWEMIDDLLVRSGKVVKLGSSLFPPEMKNGAVLIWSHLLAGNQPSRLDRIYSTSSLLLPGPTIKKFPPYTGRLLEGSILSSWREWECWNSF